MRQKPKLPAHFRQSRPGVCRWCNGAIVEKGKVNKRKTWHAWCLNDYFAHTDPNYARAAVYKRDRGICQCCNLNLEEIWNKFCALRSIRQSPDEPDTCFESRLLRAQHELSKLENQLKALGFSDDCIKGRRSLYDSDHIEPVWKSGGLMRFFSLENQQLLCYPCHKLKSKKDTDDFRRSRK